MKLLIQRVNSASVEVENKVVGQIKKGLLVFLGVEKDDTREKADDLIKKLLNLRVFANKDNSKHFDQSLLDIQGEVLVVSQFTLCADLSKGRRPDFYQAASPDLAKELYQYFVSKLKVESPKGAPSGLNVQTGEFGAYMQVKLENDGPSTFVLGI